MKEVNPSPAAVGGHFDAVSSPTGPLDKSTKAALSSAQPSNIPHATANPVPAGNKPAAEGGVY